MFKSVRFVSFAAAAVWLAGGANASDKLEIAPPESWVEPVALADVPSKNAINASVALLNASNQLNFKADGDAFYSELAFKIQTPEGLPAGQATVDWNPAIQDVTVHKVHILRDGKVIDVLQNQTFTIIRRETNLEQSMLDGELTAVLQPEGLRVGDVLNYSLTITTRDPALKGHAESFVSIPGGAPVARMSYRALWPSDKTVRWSHSSDLSEPKVSKTKAGTELLIEMSDYEQPEPPSLAPLRFNNFGEIQFSQFASWKALSAVLAPLYVKASSLAESSPLKAEAARIRAESNDPKVQAAAALKLVETQVRYVYLAANEGGYVPAAADTTWERRFGDCKGKTALLMALLKELGIAADAAVVNTTFGDGMDGRLPMAALFDHVIVRVQIGGATYWLDGTRFGDGALDRLPVPNYYWALPLTDAGSDLVALKPKPLDAPESEFLLKLDASSGLDTPAPAEAEALFRGDRAQQVYLGWKGLSPDDLEKSQREYWEDSYDWIEIEKVAYHYDEVSNEARLTMKGKGKMDWSMAGYGYGRRYLANGYYLGGEIDLKREGGLNADAPVVVSYPSYELYRTKVILPNKGKGFSVAGQNVDQILAGVDMKRSLAIRDGIFTMQVTTRSVVSEIPLKEAQAALEPLKVMGKGAVYINAPFDYSATAEDTKAAAAEVKTQPKTFEEYMARGAQAYLKGHYESAQADLDEAIRLDPKSDEALMMRATVKLARNDRSGGSEDIETIIKRNPRSAAAFAGRGSVRAMEKDFKGAIEDYTRALDLNPADISIRLQRASVFAASGDRSRALDDAMAARALQPDNPAPATRVAWLYQEDGKYAEAEAALRAGVEKWPENEGFLIQLGEFLTRCYDKKGDACTLARAEAITLYDKVLAIEPSAYAYVSRSQARSYTDREGRLKDIEMGLALEPGSTFALLARASHHMSGKDYDKALADVNAVLAVEPADRQALNVRFLIYSRLNKYEEEVADIKRILAIDPQDAESFNNLCWARATRARDLDQARVECDTAIKLKPDRAAYLDSRGLVNLQTGRFDEALADYDAAIKVGGPAASALYGRGLAKLRRGLKKEGRADMAAALKLYPYVDKNYALYGQKP